MSDLTISYEGQSFWFHKSGPVAQLALNCDGVGRHSLVNLTMYNSGDFRTYTNNDVLLRLRPHIPSLKRIGPEETVNRIIVSASNADLVKLRMISR